MLKILFSSRVGNAESFVNWATKTLFTAHMGTIEQKQELVTGILGIPTDMLKKVLRANASSVSCIYLFSLGLAKDLRESMKLSNDIDDDHIVVKYGYTDDLVRRTNEHLNDYGKIKHTQMELLYYVYVDMTNLSNAERDIKEYFNDINIPISNYKNKRELVAINPKHKKTNKNTV